MYLNNQKSYYMNYSTCVLTCIHKKLKCFNTEIPGIICGRFRYILLIDIPDVPFDHHRANLLNCSQLLYKTDKQFQKAGDELSHQSLYKVKQQQNGWNRIWRTKNRCLNRRNIEKNQLKYLDWVAQSIKWKGKIKSWKSISLEK